jgi:hypothetical protein
LTKSQLERALAKLGLEVEEVIVERSIDITINTPPGKCFGIGWHCLVTNWGHDWPGARKAAYADAKAQSIHDCPANCQCHEDDD